MVLVLMSLSWLLSVIFLFMKHPLSFGFVLLSQTILIALMSGILNLDYWFSYILFLIMIGGMLVLFIYMTSVASNEKFKFSNKLFIFTMIVMCLIPIIMFFDNFFPMMDSATSDLMSQSSPMMPNSSISKIFNYPNMYIMIMIIFYLLITLIAIVKITYSKMGPFRQMNP